MKRELLLYGIYQLINGLSTAGRRPDFEDVRIALYAIPVKKYGTPIFADLGDLKKSLEGLISEGLIEERGGGYVTTPRGEATALEVEKWDTGYAGHMRRLVERSVRLYLALELLAWAK